MRVTGKRSLNWKYILDTAICAAVYESRDTSQPGPEGSHVPPDHAVLVAGGPPLQGLSHHDLQGEGGNPGLAVHGADGQDCRG